MSLFLAAESAHLNLYAGLLAFSFLVGTYGHVIKSQGVILTGIGMVATVSGFFVLVVMKPFG